MRVSHYFEWEDHVTGGHYQSVQNQRTMMEREGIAYTTEPDLTADVLHLNNMGPRSLVLAKRARRRNVPVVVHTHQTAEDFRGSFVFSNALSKPLRPYLAYAYEQADRLVCPSEHNRRVVEDYADTPKTVISNGFDPDRLAGYEDLREEYLDRYDLDPPVVFNVGHVFKRKGLAAFVGTARRMPDLDFAWFGYLDPSGTALDRLIKSRDTQRLVEESPDNCTFTGYVDDVRGAFAAGDVFFFPTKNENEGMAMLEAMHCGKPPVVRPLGTFDWLEHDTHCLKVADGEFADAIDRLRDPEERERLGRNARALSEDYTLDAVRPELATLYRDVVSG